MKLVRLVLIATIAIAAPPVIAQSRYESNIGSHIPVPTPAKIPDTGDAIKRGQVAMTEFARCTVDRKTVRLRRVLLLPAEKAVGREWGELADRDCLASGEMRFKAPLLRGAIFIELERRRNTGHAGGVSWTAAPWDAKSVAAVSNDDMKLQLAMLGFADCVVGADRTSALQMVVSPPGSAAEAAALTALRPHLSQCLPQGQQFTMNRMLLQGLLAEILFRGSTPAAAAPGGAN